MAETNGHGSNPGQESGKTYNPSSPYQGGNPAYGQQNLPHNGAGYNYGAQGGYQGGYQSVRNNRQPGQAGGQPSYQGAGYPGGQNGYQGTGYPGGQNGYQGAGYPGGQNGYPGGYQQPPRVPQKNAADQAVQMLSRVDWIGLLKNTGKLFNPTYSGETSKTADQIFERHSDIVPNHIQAEENEIVVKQYNVARLRSRLTFSRAEGRLMVTNRRVLFRAAGRGIGGHTLMQHQFNMDELAGIEMHTDYKFSFLNFLFSGLLYPLIIFFPGILLANTSGAGAVIMGLMLFSLGLGTSAWLLNHRWIRLCASAFSFFSVVISMSRLQQPGLMWLFLLVSLAMLIVALVQVCFVPNLVIQIKTKSGHSALEIGSRKSIFLRTTNDDNCGFAEVLPWTDTITAMNELGTMIEDFQKQGDYALNTWVNKQ